MNKKYFWTYFGCFMGISSQAAITNLTPILFVPFMTLYGFEVWQLGVMVGVNFVSQLLADVILTTMIDRVSYRKVVLISLIMASSGLALFGLSPFIFGTKYLFYGMLAATVLFAFSGGMQEVVISPIIEAIPSNGNKGFIMSLFHSFYAWGQLFVILVTSLFLLLGGHENWWIIVLAWVALPFSGIFIFASCPVERLPISEEQSAAKTVFSPIMIFCMLAIFLGGGSEIIVNQYISTFCTVALGLEKYVSDIVCMGAFALCMGIGRVVLGKMSEKKDLTSILLVTSLLSAALYFVIGISPYPIISVIAAMLCGFTVSLMWPGVLSVAGKHFPQGGAFVFAVLAICGDIGGGSLPVVAGIIGDFVSLQSMFSICALVPLGCAACHLAIKLIVRKENKKINKN